MRLGFEPRNGHRKYHGDLVGVHGQSTNHALVLCPIAQLVVYLLFWFLFGYFHFLFCV